MSRKSFEELCQLIGPSIVKQNTRFCNAVPVEKKIACTLYYLSDEGRMRKIANVFSLGKPTVSKVTREVCKSISVNLKCLIKLPNNINEVNGNFRAAVDGSHVNIKKSVTNANDYMNRKGHYSFNMQAAADYQYCFFDVVIKWPGSVHDVRISSNSGLNESLRNEYIPSCSKIIVEGEDPVLVCILGDPAYPLLPFFNEGIRKRRI